MLDTILTDLVGLLRILLIDIVMAGDNAIAIGLIVTNLPKDQKRKAILGGIIAAAFIRIIFAILVQYLLQIPGLNLIGGLLLLWVCWVMGRELCFPPRMECKKTKQLTSEHTLRKAIINIVITDISLSLDNVLGVAGAAEANMWLLVGGLVLSIALMGMAASLIAQLLTRYSWIAWLGLLIILSVAVELSIKGVLELNRFLPA